MQWVRHNITMYYDGSAMYVSLYLGYHCIRVCWVHGLYCRRCRYWWRCISICVARIYTRVLLAFKFLANNNLHAARSDGVLFVVAWSMDGLDRWWWWSITFWGSGEVTAAVSFFQSAMMANDRVNPMHPQRQALALFIISWDACRFPHHGKLTWTLARTWPSDQPPSYIGYRRCVRAVLILHS